MGNGVDSWPVYIIAGICNHTVKPNIFEFVNFSI